MDHSLMVCLEKVVNENIHLKKEMNHVAEDLWYISECIDVMYHCAQDDEQDKLLLELGKLYGYIKSLSLEVPYGSKNKKSEEEDCEGHGFPDCCRQEK